MNSIHNRFGEGTDLAEQQGKYAQRLARGMVEALAVLGSAQRDYDHNRWRIGTHNSPQARIAFCCRRDGELAGAMHADPRGPVPGVECNRYSAGTEARAAWRVIFRTDQDLPAERISRIL